MNGELHRVVALTNNWPGSAVRALVISEKTGIKAEYLISLAEARFLPHYRIEGGEPLFLVSEVKEWFARNKMSRVEGREFPDELRILPTVPKGGAVPEQLRAISGLRDITHAIIRESGIYFLVCDGVVVYVGQSIRIGSRVNEHAGCYKIFDQAFFFPWAQTDLSRMEGAFIKALSPKLNGDNGPCCIGDPEKVISEVKT